MIHIKSMKGIVVEVEKDSVLVLTTEGELLDVETNGQNYEIGEEISFNKLIETKKVIRWNRVLSHTSALAATVLLFFTGIPLLDDGVNSGNAYAATVYVESKSNVQVSINQDQKVVNTSPIDAPAKKILKGISWKDEPINKFIDDYFHSEKDHGYLTKNDKAIIAVVQPSTKTAVKTLQTIEKAISSDKDLDSNDVLTVTVPTAVVEKAKSIGVTPGKYAFYLAAKDQGKEIPTNVLKTSSVTELVSSDTKVANALPKYSADKLATLANQNVIAVASAPIKNETKSDPATSTPNHSNPNSSGNSTTTPSTTQPTPTKSADNTNHKQTDNTNNKSTDNTTNTKQTDNTNNKPTNDNKNNKPADEKKSTCDTKPIDTTKPVDIAKPADNTKPADSTKPADNEKPCSKDPSTPPPASQDGQNQDTEKPYTTPAQPTGTNINTPAVPVVTTNTNAGPTEYSTVSNTSTTCYIIN